MQLAPGAVDDAGNIYVAYPESVHDYPDYNGGAIKVVHSTDNLKTWSKPLTIEPTGGVGHILPHIVGGESGKIGLAYYSGGAGNLWYSDTAQVLDALSAAPHVTHTRLSNVVVEKGTASELMGACMQGQQATLNGFACGRSTDVNGIAADACGNLLVTFPSQTGGERGHLRVPADLGPRLRSGGAVCGQSAVPPTVIKPVAQPPAAPPPGSGGGVPLATTGAPAGLAALALLLLTAALLLRRRART